ncbi:MAG TPA: SpoIIE family protein phosphatase [Vicinamibacteria bacterium]|nr:SpoIIE family protein phosphatase [Vicinamibacteria bacterium]
MSASTPVVYQYQQALDQFRREGREPPLLKRMSELISLLDLTTTLNSGLAGEEILDAALLIVMGELQVSRGALFVRGADGAFAVRASRGFPPGASSTMDIGMPPDDLTALGPGDETPALHGLVLLCPILRGDRPIAVLGLGPRAGGRGYGPEEEGFLRSVAACAATPIENGLIHDELRRVNQKLSVKVFQLHNLFDISRELTGSFEEEAIQGLITTTVMGHFVVSRCALYLLGPGGLSLAHERGLRRDVENAPIPAEEARAALQDLLGPREVSELPDGALRRRLEETRMALVVPLAAGARVEGILAIGERASRMPFSEEDRDFAQTLARQAMAALDNARLHRLRVQKQRQDRELQIAREIQRSLFPPLYPDVPGFEVAAESRSCFEVGGDSYDWIQLGGDRLALVVADVSGKGTPASILMASVHASVRALAGTAAPARLVERLNRFLFASTQANKYVTLFYAELDPASRRLAYVNAGHVPPYRLAPDGTVSRLLEGGPALGLLDGASYEAGEVSLQPGDAVAMVTDGVTEANSPDEREFGDERVCETLRALSGRTASAILEGLVAAVNEWAGAAGCSDDLTALVLRAR